MSIRSTGLSDYEKVTAEGGGSLGDDLGGYSVNQFCRLFGGISRGLFYAEVRAGRVRLSKAGARSIITKPNARRYQRLLEAEAEAKAVP